MKPNYRIIYNYDSGPVFFQKEPVTPEHVYAMVDLERSLDRCRQRDLTPGLPRGIYQRPNAT